MSYNWENGGRPQRKKVKKTGTVVLHTDAAVDVSFERLTKPYPMERTIAPTQLPQDSLPALESRKTGIDIPLMTTRTAEALRTVMGFEALLPCQAQCYRGIFKARDVILHSRTGSGKTLAYALPVIERQLIMKELEEKKKKEEEHSTNSKKAGEAAAEGKKASKKNAGKQPSSSSSPASPFLLIFVFSNDLAVQTQSVLARLYPQLHICVAGFDTITAETPVDILIGTLRTIDSCVRGHRAAAEADEREAKHREMNAGLFGHKRTRAETNAKTEDEDEDEDDDELQESSSDSDSDEDDDDEGEPSSNSSNKKKRKTEGEAGEEEAQGKQGGKGKKRPDPHQRPRRHRAPEFEGAVVSAASVRCIVVDEVDTTLGPRFSGDGRRMKNLLKTIRRANGALTDGLLTDFRSHHYVLCGATIPNWVIKAGFLGLKKYYYQLVAAGEEKLPAQLLCWVLRCPVAARVPAAVALLQNCTGAAETALGRTAVFGNNSQLLELAEALERHGIGARLLAASKPEAERIASLGEFNRGSVDVLLCTDLAARGLDLANVRTVLMLTLPPQGTALAAETFVHRAGRSARVGREGQCLVLCDQTEEGVLDGVVKSTHAMLRKFPVQPPVAAAIREGAAATTTAAEGEAEADGEGRASGRKGKGSSKRSSSSSAATAALNTTRFMLTVRDPFRYRARPAGAVPPPPALEVLQAALGTELASKAVRVPAPEDSAASTEVVTFDCDSSIAHEVRKKLWRYDLKEM